MRYEVQIRIRGEQYYEETRESALETSEHLGTLERLPEGWRLCYEERAADDAVGTQTELLIAPEQITLTRRGGLASKMVFSPSKPHKSLYETPYGALTMEVSTDTVGAKLTERGGVIGIGYALAVDGRALSKNKLRIQVKTIE